MATLRAITLHLVGIGLAVGLVACSAPAPEPALTPTPTETFAPSGDSVLRFGTLFPTTGSLAFLAPAQIAGVEVAVREINDAGGVDGAPVEVFHRNSGDITGTTLDESFTDLTSKSIDVIIGPSTSALAERLIPLAVKEGDTVISPAATFPSLTSADDAGLFFRTVPSYADQGILLAEELSSGDPVAVALIHVKSDLGEALASALEAGLADTGSELVANESFEQGKTDATKTVAAIVKANPDVVVLATTAETVDATKAFITQLSAAGLGGTKLWLTSQNTADYSQALPAGLMTGVHGIIEGAQPDAAFIARLKQSDPALSSYRYSAEAYDATILAALAAIVIGDDAGTSVARALEGVSTGGIKCTSFGECLDVLKTQDDIDYDGLSGPLNFTSAGDISPAYYALYTYNAGNTFEFSKGVVGG